MRKNAVNRQLNKIDGGVCAVAGFTANTARCAFDADFLSDDVGFIFTDKKCAVAFLGDASPMCGAPVKVSRHHAGFGYARGILFNNAVANAYGEGSEKLSKMMCWEVARKLRVDATSIIVASTGKIGKTFTLNDFVPCVPELIKGLDFTQTQDEKLALALDAKHPKQLAFSFELGDFTCKIGAVFKGNTRVAPNLATTLCFLTTDVNITPEMLQKALTSVVNDTFNQLCIDCVSSPNDCICMLANGKAGNYKISNDDNEYKKFVFALADVMDQICRALVANESVGERAFLCKVKGARSKKLARDIAKSVISAEGIKARLQKGEAQLGDFYGAIIRAGEMIDETKLTIALCNENGRIVLMEDGNPIPVVDARVAETLQSNDISVEIGLGNGNYTATGYGRINNVNHS